MFTFNISPKALWISIASSAIRYLTNMPKTSIFMPIPNMTQQTIKTNSLIWAFLIPTLEPFTTRLLNTLPSWLPDLRISHSSVIKILVWQHINNYLSK